MSSRDLHACRQASRDLTSDVELFKFARRLHALDEEFLEEVEGDTLRRKRAAAAAAGEEGGGAGRVDMTPMERIIQWSDIQHVAQPARERTREVG